MSTMQTEELDRAIRRSHVGDLRPNERVILERRRHPLWIVQHGWPAILFFLASLIATLALFLSSAGGPPSSYLVIGVGVAVLIGTLATAWYILDWTNDFFILTNQRVIFLDKTIGVHETRSEAPLNKVHNVRYDILSPLASSLNYGTLSLDTAGVGVLSFDMIPRPKEVERLIMEQRKGLTESVGQSRGERRRKVLQKIVLGQQDPTDLPPSAPYSRPRERGLGTFNRIFPFTPQQQGETIIWHRHWAFLVSHELLPIALFTLLTVLLVFYLGTIAGYDPNSYPPPSGFVGTLVGAGGLVAGFFILAYIVVLFIIWYQWEDWRNDRYSLTHDRVIDIDKKPLGFRTSVKETLFNRITDVSYSLPSPFAMIFNYGTVEIKTPGEATVFSFNDVPNPRGVQQEIMTRLEKHRTREQASWDNDIVDWLNVYHEVLNRSNRPSVPELPTTRANPALPRPSSSEPRLTTPAARGRDDAY